MKRNLLYKSIFIVAVVVICLLAITGIPNGVTWNAWKASTLARIHLGLDLQGGTHMILQVHVDDAVRSETASSMQRLQEALAGKGIGYTSLTQPDPAGRPQTIEIQGVPLARVNDFRSLAQDTLGNTYDLNSTSNGTFDMSLNAASVTEIKQRALDQSIETIGNRVNQLGVTEPTVQQHGLGQYEILVQLPGLTDADEVKSVMEETAQLEFRLGKNAETFPSEAAAIASYGGVLPEDTQVLPGSSIGSGGPDGAGATQYYVVSRSAVVSGTDLRDAEPQANNNGQMEVTFNLTRDAGQRFGNFTAANINKYLDVVLDGKVQEHAVIQGRIEDTGEITGRFTRQQAQDLALVLRSGALPASLQEIDNEQVGPSLGADSIHSGVIAAMTGFLVVAGFMLFYYHGAGVNAVLALVLNLVILMAYMASVSATLTLPGIAGIILTIGMAVDSNVLIFERIREEIRHGKSVPASVDIGFRQALITIIDTHVTTVASAICLFLFGTGPIKGFAVTLVTGLVANLFTAVFVSRVIFDYVLLRQQGIRGAKLSLG